MPPAAPTSRLEKEPQGRIRWREPDEEDRLVAACATRGPDAAGRLQPPGGDERRAYGPRPVQTDIRAAFENAVKAAKLDDFRFHDSRYHFASWFVLGHATLTMTMRCAHLASNAYARETATHRGTMISLNGLTRQIAAKSLSLFVVTVAPIVQADSAISTSLTSEG